MMFLGGRPDRRFRGRVLADCRRVRNGFNPNAPTMAGATTRAFSIALFATVACVVGWVPSATDYARYLPSTTGRGATIRSAALVTVGLNGIGYVVACWGRRTSAARMRTSSC